MTVTIDSAKVDAFMRNPGGPVMRDMLRRGHNVAGGARAQVGKDTHRLVRDIDVQAGNGAVRVGSTSVEYALMHHEGTRPHVIRPRRAKTLRFVTGGRVVFARRVNHPGARANRYLTDSLRLAAR